MKFSLKPMWIAAAVCCGSFAQPLFGGNAVYIPGLVGGGYSGGSIEVQGSSGRIDVPVAFQGASVGPFLSVVGATATDSTTYTLLGSSVPSDNSVLVKSDPHTGASLGTIQLGARLSDIAFSNGQLYGIGSTSNALQLYTIAANGTASSILNQSMPSSSATWRLSGAADGNGLLAARGDFSSINVPGFVINPSTSAVSQITLAGTKNDRLYDTVINAPANAVTSVGIVGQNITSFPGGASQGPVASNARYGTAFVSNAVSDEFNYNYSPSLPAVVQTQWNATVSPLEGVTDGLTRTPQVVSLSGPIVITNYATPDATTLSNVTVTNQIQQYFGPQFGTTPFTVSVQNSAPGDLSNRVVGQGAATLDLATAERGFYSVSSSSSITADYTYGSTADHGRTVQASGGGGTLFTYEPISSNLVGNGDGALGGAGWQGMEGSFRQFQSQHVNSAPTQHGFILTPFANMSAEMRQFLQVPTPDSPMQLSFTYDLRALPANSDELQVYLNSVLVADLFPSTTTLQTFQTEIDDPSLRNLSDAVLLIRGTSTAQFGDNIDINNIVLTAVPEPSMGCLVAIAAAALSQRRRKRSSFDIALADATPRAAYGLSSIRLPSRTTPPE